MACVEEIEYHVHMVFNLFYTLYCGSQCFSELFDLNLPIIVVCPHLSEHYKDSYSMCNVVSVP